MSFGYWLKGQRHRSDSVGLLAQTWFRPGLGRKKPYGKVTKVKLAWLCRQRDTPGAGLMLRFLNTDVIAEAIETAYREWVSACL